MVLPLYQAVFRLFRVIFTASLADEGMMYEGVIFKVCKRPESSLFLLINLSF